MAQTSVICNDFSSSKMTSVNQQQISHLKEVERDRARKLEGNKYPESNEY